MDKVTQYTCRWCGETGPLDDFDEDTTWHEGFWCPDCDGYTFFDEKKNTKRQMLLLLESKDSVPAQDAPKNARLNKRLSPLRYPGGKSRLADYIAEQLDPDKMDTFCECFAGGASVGLALLDAGRTKHLVLNDTDIGVFSFWKTVVEKPDSLIKHLESPVYRADYGTAKGILETPHYFSVEDVAWAELLCNRLSFSGITVGGIMGGPNGSDERLFCRYNPNTLIKRIEHIQTMADRITVSNVDAMELIEKVAYWDDHTTLFVDPPYVRVGKRLYQNYFEDDDHANLAEMLQSLHIEFPCANIIITYDDCELIRELYPAAEVRVIGRRYSLQTADRT